MGPTVETIRQCLGTLVFGEEEDELEHAVLRLLDQRGKKLSTAEAGTHGLLAQMLSEAAPEQTSYIGGKVFGSETALAATHEGAANMAQQCRHEFSTDYSLAIGPFPATDENAGEPPSYHFALASRGGEVIVRSSTLSSHPSIWKPRAAKQALNLLRLTLLEGQAVR
jgi:nicotinamide-nucleotide amidase